MAGDTAIDCNVASVTVSVVDGANVPTEAEMVVDPAVTPAKRTGVRPKLTFPATVVSEEDQFVARLVTSRVLPSVNIPTAENRTCVLLAIEEAAGSRATETRFDKSTVNVGGEVRAAVDCPPNDALIVYVPMPFPVVNPLFELMKAPNGENDHLVTLVTSWVDISLNVAVAVNCCPFKNPIVAVAGVTASEETVAEVTVNCAPFDTLPKDALITAVPGVTAVARPCVGESLLTVATVGMKQAHCAVVVKSLVVPSE